MKRIIYGILVIAWMILILSFSNQTGEESQGVSDIITDKIVEVVIKVNSNLEYKDVKDIISFIIRKGAHFSIYFIGGILIFNFLNTFPMNKKTTILLTIVIGILYAISDEIHQLFISGRAGQIQDVLIDSSGIIIATILVSKIKGEKWKS